jgi:hypothetical protein
MTVGTDRMQRFLVEIARGVAIDSSVLAPFTAEERNVWASFVQDFRDAQAGGYIIEIPNEWPSLDGYVLGEVPGIEHIP